MKFKDLKIIRNTRYLVTFENGNKGVYISMSSPTNGYYADTNFFRPGETLTGKFNHNCAELEVEILNVEEHPEYFL